MFSQVTELRSAFTSRWVSFYLLFVSDIGLQDGLSSSEYFPRFHSQSWVPFRVNRFCRVLSRIYNYGQLPALFVAFVRDCLFPNNLETVRKTARWRAI